MIRFQCTQEIGEIWDNLYFYPYAICPSQWHSVKALSTYFGVQGYFKRLNTFREPIKAFTLRNLPPCSVNNTCQWFEAEFWDYFYWAMQSELPQIFQAELKYIYGPEKLKIESLTFAQNWKLKNRKAPYIFFPNDDRSSLLPVWCQMPPLWTKVKGAKHFKATMKTKCRVL